MDLNIRLEAKQLYFKPVKKALTSPGKFFINFLNRFNLLYPSLTISQKKSKGEKYMSAQNSPDFEN